MKTKLLTLLLILISAALVADISMYGAFKIKTTPKGADVNLYDPDIYLCETPSPVFPVYMDEFTEFREGIPGRVIVIMITKKGYVPLKEEIFVPYTSTDEEEALDNPTVFKFDLERDRHKRHWRMCIYYSHRHRHPRPHYDDYYGYHWGHRPWFPWGWTVDWNPPHNPGGHGGGPGGGHGGHGGGPGNPPPPPGGHTEQKPSKPVIGDNGPLIPGIAEKPRPPFTVNPGGGNGKPVEDDSYTPSEKPRPNEKPVVTKPNVTTKPDEKPAIQPKPNPHKPDKPVIKIEKQKDKDKDKVKDKDKDDDVEKDDDSEKTKSKDSRG